jgi:hypothetical protein
VPGSFMPPDIMLLKSILFSGYHDELINDFIPRSSKNFYEKGNDELYALVLPFNKFNIEYLKRYQRLCTISIY